MEIPFERNCFQNERNCFQDPFSLYESHTDLRGNSIINFLLDSEGMVQIQDHIMSSLYSSFPESTADSLDDIDPDTLFYQKSFTELTPMRCDPMRSEVNVADMLSTPQITESSNGCSNSSVPVGLEMSHKSSPLEDFNKKNNFPNINQSNFYEQSSLQKFLPTIFHQDYEEPMVLNESSFESYQEPQINYLDDFELALINTSPYPLTSEYINYDAAVYEVENDSFETESNVSSTDSCSSTQESFHPESPTDFGERSWVKEIKVGKNNRPRGPKCWEFLLRLLRDNASNPSLVKWENPEIGSFKLVEKDKISAIWGNRPSKKKNGKIIKYESFARILRYHYKKGSGMVLPVSEKHLVYKFASKVMAAYRAGKIL